MAKRRPTVVASKIFKTQNDAKDYTRKILLSLEEKGEVLPGEKHWDFLQDLIKGHHQWPEKYGTGIAKFLIGRSIQGNNIELNLERTDGSTMDISWVKSITGTATSPIKNLNAAMRESIDYQIDAFKAKNYSEGDLCGLCRSPADNDLELHVDHHSPTFHELFNTFITKNQNFPIVFDDCPATNRAMFMKKDREFKKKWQDFHSRNAKLHCTHKDCNLRRKKK